MSERENFYDTEIAPALLELARRCQERGLSLVAAVEWAPGETGSTRAIVPGAGFGIRLTDVSTKANGNVDALFLAIIKHARQHGHSSVYLRCLGVPVSPGESEFDA